MNKTPTLEQLQAAKREITASESDENDFVRFHHFHYQTIQFALRFTAKALWEPSDEMLEVGYSWLDGTEVRNRNKACFKAMIQQLAKECEE